MTGKFLIVAICALAALSEAYMSKRYKASLRGEELPQVKHDPESPLNHYYKEQLVDHFDALNTKTWTQRYWVNDTFFHNKHGDSPVFLCVGMLRLFVLSSTVCIYFCSDVILFLPVRMCPFTRWRDSPRL
jgi:hypothetical protein